MLAAFARVIEGVRPTPGLVSSWSIQKLGLSTEVKVSEQTTTSVPATSAAPKEDEWTEVVDQKTGQTYYWNQQTGETTDLGESKPTTRYKNPEYEKQEDFAGYNPNIRTFKEPPLPDRTAQYTLLGITLGVLAGWATQYMH